MFLQTKYHATATVMSEAHYYPFGLEIKDLTYLSKTI